MFHEEIDMQFPFSTIFIVPWFGELKVASWHGQSYYNIQMTWAL